MDNTLLYLLHRFIALMPEFHHKTTAAIDPKLLSSLKEEIEAYPNTYATLSDSEKISQFIDLNHQLIALMIREPAITTQENQQYFSDIFTALATLCIHLYEIMQAEKIDISNTTKHNLMNKLVITTTSQRVAKLSKKLFLIFYHSYSSAENTFDHLVNLKLLAHRLGLKGHSVLSSTLQQAEAPMDINFESFEPQYTMPEALYSFWNFSQKMPITSLKSCVNQTLFSLQAVVDSQHQFADITHCAQLVDQYHAGKVIVISSGLYNHSANFILADNLLAVLNRGIYAKREGADFYYIGNHDAVTPELIQSLFCATISTSHQSAYYEALFRTGIYEKLQLTAAEKYDLPAKHQTVGNCTWANIKMTVQALLLIHLIKQYPESPLPDLKKIAHYYYKAWTDFDRTYALMIYLQRYFYHPQAHPCKADKDLLKNQLLMQHDLKKPGEVQRGVLATKALGDEAVQALMSAIQEHTDDIKNAHQALQFLKHCQEQAAQDDYQSEVAVEDPVLIEDPPSYLTSFKIHSTKVSIQAAYLKTSGQYFSNPFANIRW